MFTTLSDGFYLHSVGGMGRWGGKQEQLHFNVGLDKGGGILECYSLSLTLQIRAVFTYISLVF